MNINFLNNKKILITGASGVIGYNLCKLLGKTNSTIYINYLNDLENPFKKILNDRFIHKQFDICDVKKIESLPMFDMIFHLSGYGQPKRFVENPEKTFLLNSLSLLALTKKVIKNGQFIFASTSELYVNSPSSKETETIGINHFSSRGCYTLGKLCGEHLLYLSQLSKKIDIKILRICLTYGPGFKKTDKRALNEFISQGMNKKEIQLMDDGSAKRCYIYVGDALKMLLKIVKNSKNTLYNIGGRNTASILSLAKSVAKITKSTLKKGEIKNKLKDSPNFAGVDISLYEKEFGKMKFTNIENGLSHCIKWYKNYDK